MTKRNGRKPAAPHYHKLSLNVPDLVHEGLEASADAMGDVPVTETIRRYIQVGNLLVDFYQKNPEGDNPTVDMGEGKSFILPLKAMLGPMQSIENAELA